MTKRICVNKQSIKWINDDSRQSRSDSAGCGNKRDFGIAEFVITRREPTGKHVIGLEYRCLMASGNSGVKSEESNGVH
jgi:hypothetical protein